MQLTAGGNCSVPTEELIIRVQTEYESDVSAYRLDLNGHVSGDEDMIFYGQRHSQDKTVNLISDGVNTAYSVRLNQMPLSVEKIAFACTCDQGKTIASLKSIAIQVERQGVELVACQVDLRDRLESALILGELYRRNNTWKFRFISQGFNGGLKPLAEFFGVDIEEEVQPLNEKKVLPTKPINLSKVSLTKNNPKVSLSKRDDYGLIKINLNWNQTIQSNGSRKGLFGGLLGGGTSNNGIDLDLGAFIRLKNGEKFVVQAVGGGFGELNNSPYVQLLADDRTGNSAEGEWLHINGRHWSEIDEVLVYAFIYEGVPDWTKTDGVITVYVPNEPPLETRLTEGNRSNGLCGIARFINQNGELSVERINRYFSGHKALDCAFNWNFRWVAGRK
jgi:tellurite resistance protein TerA